MWCGWKKTCLALWNVFTYTYNKVSWATKCKPVPTRHCFVVCLYMCLYYEVSSCARAWPDNLKTDPRCVCHLSDLFRPLRSCGARKNAIQPLLHGRAQFALSLVESHHCAMEGNGFRCTVKLFGYEAAPEVCLLGADGQLLQPPASGAVRIEYFLLGDV